MRFLRKRNHKSPFVQLHKGGFCFLPVFIGSVSFRAREFLFYRLPPKK